MKSLIIAECEGSADKLTCASYTASLERKTMAKSRYIENISKAAKGDIVALAYLRGWNGDESDERRQLVQN